MVSLSLFPLLTQSKELLVDLQDYRSTTARADSSPILRHAVQHQRHVIDLIQRYINTTEKETRADSPGGRNDNTT